MENVCYDDLKEGRRKGYAFELVKLYEGPENKRKGLLFDRSIYRLYEKITKILQEIETTQKRAIKMFSIGVTYPKYTKLAEFDPMNSDTWKTTSFEGYLKANYIDFDGVIVLCGVSQDLIPNARPNARPNENAAPNATPNENAGPNATPNNWSYSNYALDLRHRLMYIFTFDDRDARATRGIDENKCSSTSAVALLYMAFKLGKKEAKQQPVAARTLPGDGDTTQPDTAST
ncbi:uncharacterized protein LOC128242774 [Mya arenaria]|uniref:uncharacterized protein LOC128242774 n=1 Tax=Mya arenaria TaxID=6604 RepID=UPI0022E9068B|nr:uncharacterized protein LOC128242774 [Mya arenaria]